MSGEYGALMEWVAGIVEKEGNEEWHLKKMGNISVGCMAVKNISGNLIAPTTLDFPVFPTSSASFPRCSSRSFKGCAPVIGEVLQALAKVEYKSRDGVSIFSSVMERRAYVQGVLDSQNVRDFPLEAVLPLKEEDCDGFDRAEEALSKVHGKKRKVQLIEESESEEEEIASMEDEELLNGGVQEREILADNVPLPVVSTVLVEGSYYEVPTVMEWKENEVEMSYFRVNRVWTSTVADVTWLYTYEQMERECKKAGYEDEVPKYVYGDDEIKRILYVSTHVQSNFSTETLKVRSVNDKIDVVNRSMGREGKSSKASDEGVYRIVGVFDVQEPMTVWTMENREEGRMQSLVSHLLLRGSQTIYGAENLKRKMAQTLEWDRVKVAGYKDVCDVCLLPRRITAHVNFGRRKIKCGKDCYRHVKLAYDMLHYKENETDVQELFDDYEAILCPF